jgi:uncharacterized protein (TIGR02246 family)
MNFRAWGFDAAQGAAAHPQSIHYWQGITDMSSYQRSGNAADLAALDKVRDVHVAALNAGDAAAWVALFADDGVQMPPNFPANVGKAAIGPWSHGLLSHFKVRFALAVDEVHVVGDWAFERGGYEFGMSAPAGGPAMQDSGKYITIYRKAGAGGWLIARDIWNSNNPPPGAPA